ncbi:MAG: DUF5063 domain-containing protein [Phycisphaerae bacterium]
MDSVDQFAAEAERFAQWASHGTAHGEAGVTEALVRLTHLYVTALDLPPAWDQSLTDEPDAACVADDEWQAIAARCAGLPFDTYGEVFDPLRIPPEEPVIGMLSDDIADIYRDVVTGLRAYHAGRRAQAVWEWRFNFNVHWGKHATGAIRALHCWLASRSGSASGSNKR